MRRFHYAWLGAASMVLALGTVQAADNDPPGFNELDKNDDGYLTKAESAANPTVASNFDQMDEDGDGKVSRADYLQKMAAKDFRTLREKAADLIDPGKKTETGSGSATGATKQK